MNGKVNKSNFLESTFGNTTNSYKFFWFLAILKSVQREPEQAIFSFEELTREMLFSSWYPVVYFKLSLGKQDQLAKTLSKIPEINTVISSRQTATNVRDSIELNYAKIQADKLHKYVPFRFIRPFFQRETSNIKKDSVVNELLSKLSREQYSSKLPYYKITEDNKFICIHDEWLPFFRDNNSILTKWIYFELAKYLVKHNPNTPNILNKLSPEFKRRNLAKERADWASLIHKKTIVCPYSGKRLHENSFHLDHYLPWKFIAHDKVWNLTASDPGINLRKGDKVPDDSFFERFVSNQKNYYDLLVSSGKNNAFIEDFTIDLLIYPDDELDCFYSKYDDGYTPLLKTALHQGFQYWHYEKSI